jgi:MoxR-like ATPase
MEGTYPLPEAQLDRFFLKLHIPFPRHEDLHEILDRTTGNDRPMIRAVLGKETVIEARALARKVAVARHVQDYAIRILEASHPDRKNATPLVRRYVRYGASPRGVQSCLMGAKIEALYAGRFNVSIDDIRRVVTPALRHRIILNFEGEAEGISTDRVLEEILSAIPESAT